MIPLATVGGIAVIGSIVGSAALFLRWLMREESRKEAAEGAEEEAARKTDPDS